MTLQEFAKLKTGDAVRNPMNGSAGQVSSTSSYGVYIVWGPRHDNEKPFFYGPQSTAWMHWVVESAA